MKAADPTDAIADRAEAMLAELGDFEHSQDRWDTEADRLDPPPVTLQRRSANPKLSPTRREWTPQNRWRFVPTGPYCASTYASIEHTCPNTCPYKGNGCFAQAGAQHLTMGRLSARAKAWDWSALEISFAEGELIDRFHPGGAPQDGARGGRDVRLHVGGDVSCRLGAIALAVAASRYRRRGGGAVWTYTHRWREIRRTAWGNAISVLASVETEADLELAAERGYAAAVTVPAFPAGGRPFTMGALRSPIGRNVHKSTKSFTSRPFTVIPCPAETKGKTCVECRLCLDHDLLRRRQAIGFALHGAQVERARASLRVLQPSQGAAATSPGAPAPEYPGAWMLL